MAQWSGMPNHVMRYLEENEVNPNDLPQEVKETLAALSLGEVALLKIVGDSLQGLDKDVICKVH